jgi:hypothetical protein
MEDLIRASMAELEAARGTPPQNEDRPWLAGVDPPNLPSDLDYAARIMRSDGYSSEETLSILTAGFNVESLRPQIDAAKQRDRQRHEHAAYTAWLTTPEAVSWTAEAYRAEQAQKAADARNARDYLAATGQPGWEDDVSDDEALVNLHLALESEKDNRDLKNPTLADSEAAAGVTLAEVRSSKYLERKPGEGQ